MEQKKLTLSDFSDAQISNAQRIVKAYNAAIANRYFDFPAPVGMVKAHENFRIVAAGNTVGTGADSEYVGRFQLDAASLDRFAVVRIQYSDLVEQAMAGGDEELLSFCRAFRNATHKAGVQAIVSYRGIKRLAKMAKLLDIKTASQPMDLKRVSYPLMHTAFFRVVGFDWYSRTPRGKYRDAYGTPMPHEWDDGTIRAAFKEMFGKNAIVFSAQSIIRERSGDGKANQEHIKEVLTSGPKN